MVCRYGSRAGTSAVWVVVIEIVVGIEPVRHETQALRTLLG